MCECQSIRLSETARCGAELAEATNELPIEREHRDAVVRLVADEKLRLRASAARHGAGAEQLARSAAARANDMRQTERLLVVGEHPVLLRVGAEEEASSESEALGVPRRIRSGGALRPVEQQRAVRRVQLAHTVPRELRDVQHAVRSVDRRAAGAHDAFQERLVLTKRRDANAPIVVSVADENVTMRQWRQVGRQGQLAKQLSAHAARDSFDSEEGALRESVGEEAMPPVADRRRARAVGGRRIEMREDEGEEVVGEEHGGVQLLAGELSQLGGARAHVREGGGGQALGAALGHG
mmetsp:Transcript_19965/g.45874  ORF Transcript_19965/g.45874 Transcript_19965/m.45874 type:complete len:295 (-) Transcript_19965:13-897(-)